MGKKLVYIILSLIILPYAGISQQRWIDSLTSLLEKSPDQQKIKVYEQIVIGLWRNHPDSALIYAYESGRLARKMNDLKALAITTRLIGGAYYYKGMYDSVIAYSHKAVLLSQETKDSTLIASSLNNIGLAYHSVGGYPEALQYLLPALSLKKRIKQEYGMAQTLNNVGLVYTELKNYNKAREYLNEALEFSKATNDQDNVVYSLNNIGETYLRENEIATAENYYDQSLAVAGTVIRTVIWHAAAYKGKGRVLLERGQLAKAKKYFKQSISLSKQIDEQSGQAEVLSYFSEICSKEGKLDSAFYFLRKAQIIATRIRARDQVLNNLNSFKELFIKQRRFDSALLYSEKFIALKDNLFDENLARNISGIQQKILEDESRRALADKDARIRQTTLISYWLGVVVLMVVVFTLLLYRTFKTQKKLTIDLAKQNHEIFEQKEEISAQKEDLQLSHAELEAAQKKISQQNKILAELNLQLQSVVNIRTQELEVANQQLRVVNLELDNFIYKSSHDIKGPLVRLLGICHVALLDVKDEKAHEYFTMLSETAQNLNDIFNRLKVVSEIHELKIQYQPIDLVAIVRTVEEKLKDLEGYSDVEIRHQIAEETWRSDPFLIETIMHNMLENAVKFHRKSNASNKYIDIKARKKDQQMLISIADNGIGIKDSETEHIFKMFSKAALEHKTIGLGLYIVKECVSKLNGSVRLVQSENKHTEFEVALPA
ncbi:MAG: tetratricopeptide repeat-containing sensor histidine kinase [Flammeovirgaceae bacterium]|nr:tetratricopeptide repeat-containing sensor histidine kinase [Flammeovirgaceae bacterium]